MASGLSDWNHERRYLSASRRPVAASPSLAAGLARAGLRGRHADVVHVVGDTGALLCLPLLRLRPSVFDPQGLHLLRRTAGVRQAGVRRGLRAVLGVCEQTVCSSHAERDELAALAGPGGGEGLVEVPNGIPLPPLPNPERRAATRAELGLAEREVAGLFMGQLEPRKRALDAARAAEQAAERSPFVLLVAGEGPEYAALANRAGEVVRLLGFRNDPERLLEAADLSVMPSAHEGLSLAVMQSLAHGLATVVSDGPGNPEAVGDAGVIVGVGDVDALADAFTRLALDPEERVRLGTAARRRAAERFAVDRYLRDLDAVFRRATRLRSRVSD